MSETLYERIGGEPAVNAAVDIFYRKVLTDNRINRFLTTLIWKNKRPNKKLF